MRSRESRVACLFVLGVLWLANTAAAGSAGQRQSRSTVDDIVTIANVQAMIDEMLTGRRTRTLIPPLTHTYGSFSLGEAYRIQGALARRLTRDSGSVAGYKVAYASKAAQEQFGIPAPASGPLFQLQRIPSGSVLEASEFTALIIETEVAFTIGKKIDQPISSIEALKPHVKWVHASFDIGSERFDSRQAKPVVADQVANGVGAYIFVLGPAMAPSEVDVDALTLRLAVNGRTVAESAATNVMGSPWNSLLWLANQVVDRGNALEPGYVVQTGTAAPAYKAEGSKMLGSYLGDCGPLGKVICAIR